MKINPEFLFSSHNATISVFSYCSSERHCSLLPHFKFYLHEKQINLNYFEKLSSSSSTLSDVQELLRASFITRKAEPK